MLGASCGLEVSEIVLTEHREPKETELGMTSASSKDASISCVLMDHERIESKPCSVSLTPRS